MPVNGKEKMKNVYEVCPVLENKKYLIRIVKEEDGKDLFDVYSDKNALPFFNSDNCDGDNFYYPTEERMLEAIKFWRMSYNNRWFVRFSIVDKEKGKIIGTIEGFHRVSDDSYNGAGLIRLDVGSAYEQKEVLTDIFSIILKPSFELFECEEIITKVPIYAVERVEAVKALGFKKSENPLIGQNDRYAYHGYWTLRKPTAFMERQVMPL